jgi:hypothetical protein
MFKKILKIMILTASVSYAEGQHYAIIIDAGSTGSRIHLFSEDASAQVPQITDVFTEKVKPGLSSFTANPVDAGASIGKLIADANEKLSSLGVDPKDVSVSVMATAGMRALPIETQSQIYQNIRTYLTENHYDNPLAFIGTITGQQEALYGWLDVNYLNHTFTSNTYSLGSIDLGGESTQIAYEIPSNDSNTIPNIISLSINGKIYRVFGISFLGLGQDKSRQTMNQMATAPFCYPAGYSGEVSGNYNFEGCTANYDELLSSYNINAQLPAIPENEIFVAYSSIYYAYHFFDLTQSPDENNVRHRVQEICSLSWSDLQADYPSENPQYLSSYCANGTYIHELLYTQYQLTGDQLNVTDQVQNQAIDWSLGAMLYSSLTSRSQ